MWKKDEQPAETNALEIERVRSERPAATQVQPQSEGATIGRSITVRGDVSGDEDLLIQGRVEGSIDLQNNAVTVGADGEVSASIKGRIVTIEGRVEGNITAEEQAILKNSAFVRGDITAPRVVLENGARFRGGVDMGDAEDRGKRLGGPVGNRGAIKAVDSVKPAIDVLASPVAGSGSAPGKNGGAGIEVSSPILA